MITPRFIEVDPDIILQEIVTNYEDLTGTNIYPGQPEYSICTAIAYQKVLTLNKINESSNALLLDLSSAPVTDYLAALIGVTRLGPSNAVCTLRFNLVPGHLQVLLPLGTRVASTDGSVIFETSDDVTIPVGVDQVDVTSICQGIQGNGCAIGTISVIQDPYAFVASVSNIDVSSGGSDAETDAELIARVKLAPAQFSVAGSRNAYEYWTKTASPTIIDVSIMTYEDDEDILPGHVNIYTLLDSGIPSPAMNAIIQEVLSSENVRPLTDTVVVLSPTVVEYSIEINITMDKVYPSDLVSKIYTALETYTSHVGSKIGTDVIASKLEALSLISGVYDADAVITSLGTMYNNNLLISKSSIAVLTGITINEIGTDE